MRILRLILAGAVAAALATAVSAQPPSRKPTAKSMSSKASPNRAGPRTAPEPPPPPYVPGEKVRTSDEVKRGSVEGAATTPLRDLNVVKTAIPEILLQSLADPYARPPAKWRCPQLAALVRPLDDALGPDMDTNPAGDENVMDRGKSTALSVAGDLAGGAIPFRGVVRRLTGAESHDRLVQSAIVAGNVRRAYLKGLGEAKGCMPPATPSHEKAGAPPVVVTRGRLRPKYPTKEPDGPQRHGETPPPGPRK
jgi:hypothetical protein